MAEDNEVFIEDESIILEDSEESDIDDLNASKIIPFAALSLMEDPGFKNSAFPNISQPVNSLALFNLIKGVLPIVSMKFSFINFFINFTY